MFYWLIELSNTVPGFGIFRGLFNVFRYITFRTGGAMVTGALFVFLFGPWIIDHLRLRQGKGQPIREDGPQSHLIAKKGTPTMGGLMILSGLVVSTLLWANPLNPYVWIVLAVTLGFGFVGFYDDYLKVTKQSHSGFAGKLRLLIEAVIALVACYALVRLGRDATSTSLVIPFFKDVVLNLGIFFVLFGAFVMVGAGNAVNLTDGLDGLAIVPVMIAAASFGMIAYLTGNAVFSDYLQINYVAGTGELAVLCGAVLGAGLGFLWFNAPPASIFMGDTGSLALGGMLGSIAVAVKHEIVLGVIGGLFVLEAVSVIVQVVSFKLTGKRLFPVTSFAGRTVAVFGLGGSGLASCHALKAGGAEVIAGDDSADNVAKAAQAGFTTADLRTVSWANFSALILTPGAPLTHPAPHWSVLMAQQAGVEVIGDIELFCRERRRHAPDAPFVAITGTNGKSTTTALIAHLTKVAGYDTQMGGNIGTAILSLEPPRMGRVHVVEVSSYQIDLAPSLDPSVGILINLSEDHIDRHGTMANYAQVKERLVAGVQPNGTAVIGVDD